MTARASLLLRLFQFKSLKSLAAEMDKMRYFLADLDDGTIGDVLAGNIPALCGRPA